jgi:Na+-transporting NADH:ubiquinone oxidoreductase subunit NqrD
MLLRALMKYLLKNNWIQMVLMGVCSTKEMTVGLSVLER